MEVKKVLFLGSVCASVDIHIYTVGPPHRWSLPSWIPVNMDSQCLEEKKHVLPLNVYEFPSPFYRFLTIQHNNYFRSIYKAL